MDLDMADIKPSALSFVTVGLMAVLFIVLLKMLDRKYPVAGLHDVVQMV